MSDFLVLASNSPTQNLLTGVAVLALAEDRIALLDNHRHPIAAPSWEIVKGFIDTGETPEAAALRELGEETGYFCAPEDLIPLGTYTPEPAAMAARGALFLARRCVPGAVRDDQELGLGEVTLVPVPEVLRMAAESVIEDASTLIALFRALPWLRD